jgi:hypothetical protein
MDERVRTGVHIVQTFVAILPHLCFGKKSCSWSNTEEQVEASLHRGRSAQTILVVWTDDALDSWVFGRYITSSERLQGI